MVKKTFKVDPAETYVMSNRGSTAVAAVAVPAMAAVAMAEAAVMAVTMVTMVLVASASSVFLRKTRSLG